MQVSLGLPLLRLVLFGARFLWVPADHTRRDADLKPAFLGVQFASNI